MADYAFLLRNIMDFLYKDNDVQYPGKGRVFYTRRVEEGFKQQEKDFLENLMVRDIMENEIPFALMNDPEKGKVNYLSLYQEKFLSIFDKKRNIKKAYGRLSITNLIFLGIHLGGWIPASRWFNGRIENHDRAIVSNLMKGDKKNGTEPRRNDFISDNDRSSPAGYIPITEYIVTCNHELIKNCCPGSRKEHLKDIINDFVENQPQASEKTSLYSSDEGDTIQYLREKLKKIIEHYANASGDDKNWLLARALTWLIIGAFLQDHLDKDLIDNYMVPYINIGNPSISEVRDSKPSIAYALVYDQLMERFLNQYNEHPSIKMMTPDPRLFPKGLPTIKNSMRTAKEGDQEPASIKDMILKSWEEPERKHILLVGEGGIGKTVAMLTLPKEDWFRENRIPVIYIPLQTLDDPYKGELKKYIDENYRNEIDAINQLATASWKRHPNLIILLDGFNEIPMEFRYTAEKHIRAWMDKPGVQIITTSRINSFLSRRFLEYTLQPLPYETCREYLLTTDTNECDLPSENSNIWKVINTPLMLTMYTQIDNVKERTEDFAVKDFFEWKESDNAAHIIWNYMQVELYRLIDIDGSAPVLSTAAILAVAPYVCYEMAEKGQFYVEQDDYQEIICNAVRFFTQNPEMLPGQIEKIRKRFGNRRRDNPFEDDKWESYFDMLSERSVLFQIKANTNQTGNNTTSTNKSGQIFYVPAHQNFRDALAAIFISGCLLNSTREKQEFPEKILNTADFYVKNYISELLTDDELLAIWDYHRVTEPENGNVTVLLMDMLGTKRNYDFRELNFSGLDFTEINVYPIIFKRQDICSLPTKAELFENTKITKDSLTPSGLLSCDNIIFSKERNELFTIESNGDVKTWNLASGTFSIKSVCNFDRPGILTICGETGRFIARAGQDYRSLYVFLYDSVYHDTVNVFLEHSLKIERMAITPDERLLAVYGKDISNKNRLEVLNLKDETTLIDSTINDIRYMAFNYDGSLLGCIGMIYDNSMCYDRPGIFFFDTESKTFKIVKSCKQALYGVPLAFSRDLRYLASISDSKDSIMIQNHESGKIEKLELLFNMNKGPYIVKNLAFSPDGRFLACTLKNNRKIIIQVWDWEKRTFKDLEGNQINDVACLTFSQDGRYLVSGSINGDLIVWDWEDGSYRNLTTKKTSRYISSEDNKYVAGITSDNTIIVWDLENESCKTFKDKYIVGNHLTISPDSKYLACGSREHHAVQIWNLENGNSIKLDCLPDRRNDELYSDQRDNLWYYPWTFSPCGRWLISTNYHGIIRVWDLKKQVFKILGYDLGGGNFSSFSLRFIDENNVAVQGNETSNIIESLQIWNLESGKSSLSGIEKKVTGLDVTISPLGKYVVSVLDWRTILGIWDLKKESYYELNLLELGFDTLNPTQVSRKSIVFSPEENCLAFFAGKTILVWDLENRKSVIITLDNITRGYFEQHVFFSPKGNILGLIDDNTIYIFKWQNSKIPIGFYHLYSQIYLKMGLDGKYLIGSYNDNEIFALDLENLTREKVFSFPDRVVTVAFSPDRRYIAVVLHDLTVQIFDLLKKTSKVLEYGYESNCLTLTPEINFEAKGKQLSVRLSLKGNVGLTFTYDVETGKMKKRNTLWQGIVLYGANFQQAILSENEKIWFRSAGVKV